MKRYVKASISDDWLNGVISYLQQLPAESYTCREFNNLILMEIKLPVSLADEVCDWIFAGDNRYPEYNRLYNALQKDSDIVLQIYIELQGDSYEITEIAFDLPTDVGDWAESISIIEAVPYDIRQDLLDKALDE